MNDRLNLNAPGRTAIATIDQPVPAVYLFCAIVLPGGRMLGSEHFRLVQFQGQERVSELFEYQLELHGNTDEDGDALEFEDVIGRPVTVGIARPAPSPGPFQSAAAWPDDELAQKFDEAVRGGDGGPGLTLFNGIVSAFAMEIPGVYRLTMKPAMQRLALTNDYAVHAHMNVRDAIAEVLARHRIAYSMVALRDKHNAAVARVQDWLQAGESDLAFVRRLMDKAHLYYYFVHTGNSHQVVFANAPAYPQVYEDGRALRYTWSGADELGLVQEDVIFQYSYQRELTSSAVQGVFARQHACWEHDEITPPDSFATTVQPEQDALLFRQYRIYQYGCSTPEVEHYTRRTDAAMQAAAHVFSGASYCSRMRAGYQFPIASGKEGRPVRPALDGQRFVLTQVDHEADAGGGYRNQFRAAPASSLVAPYSIEETQQGSVVAVVVAKSGNMPPQSWEYYTADYYDEEKNKLTDTSPGVNPQALDACGVYVRFSSAPAGSSPVWVKLAPHMQTVPEPGVTVIVSRAQDESELPEIQSIIHSNGSKVVMPSGWTANSHVGGSYSTSYGDGKSIRFGQDKNNDLDQAKAKVETAYKTGYYREVSYSQGGSYSYSCNEGNAGAACSDKELFGDFQVGDGELLSASESFGSTFSRHIGDVVSSFSKIGTSYTDSEVTGDTTSKAKHGGSVHSTTEHTGEVYSKTTHKANVESHTTVDADSINTSVVNGRSVSDSTHTFSENTSAVVAQFSSNSVLLNTGIDFTGASLRQSYTGAAVESSMTGSHTSVQVMLQNNTVQMVANNNVIELLGPGVHISEKATQVEAETRDINVTLIVAMQIYM